LRAVGHHEPIELAGQFTTVADMHRNLLA
jgi:hypothetical protein